MKGTPHPTSSPWLEVGWGRVQLIHILEKNTKGKGFDLQIARFALQHIVGSIFLYICVCFAVDRMLEQLYIPASSLVLREGNPSSNHVVPGTVAEWAFICFFSNWTFMTFELQEPGGLICMYENCKRRDDATVPSLRIVFHDGNPYLKRDEIYIYIQALVFCSSFSLSDLVSSFLAWLPQWEASEGLDARGDELGKARILSSMGAASVGSGHISYETPRDQGTPVKREFFFGSGWWKYWRNLDFFFGGGGGRGIVYRFRFKHFRKNRFVCCFGGDGEWFDYSWATYMATDCFHVLPISGWIWVACQSYNSR